METETTINGSCAELLAAISLAVARIESLAHGVSEPFSALDNVSRSLGSLRTGLESLRADAGESQEQLPGRIIRRLCAALSDCTDAVAGIDGVLQRWGANGTWESNGEAELLRLMGYIDGHAAVLGVVVDMVELFVLLPCCRAVGDDGGWATDCFSAGSLIPGLEARIHREERVPTPLSRSWTLQMHWLLRRRRLRVVVT